MADLVVSLKAFSWEGVVVKLKTFMHRSPQISREGGSCRQQSFAPGVDAQDSNKALTHALSTSCMRLFTQVEMVHIRIKHLEILFPASI